MVPLLSNILLCMSARYQTNVSMHKTLCMFNMRRFEQECLPKQKAKMASGHGSLQLTERPTIIHLCVYTMFSNMLMLYLHNLFYSFLLLECYIQYNKHCGYIISIVVIHIYVKSKYDQITTYNNKTSRILWYPERSTEQHYLTMGALKLGTKLCSLF